MKKTLLDIYQKLYRQVDLFNEYHALIDSVGNRYCSGSTPRCGECPLGEICKERGHTK